MDPGVRLLRKVGSMVAPEHPILKGMPEDWVSPKDELYVIEKMWPGATPLVTSVSEADGKSYPVAWVNGFGKARVFGTTSAIPTRPSKIRSSWKC